jgi:hypothetical protein
VHLRHRRTGFVLTPLLMTVVVMVVAACSSQDAKLTTTASSQAVSTSAPSPSTAPVPSPSTAPTPSTLTPTPTVQSTAARTTAAPQTRQVRVATTFAGWNATTRAVEVGGYAIVVEPVGTCTLRLVHGDQVVTRQQTASADATTTACGGFSVPGSVLTAGAWQAELSYSSSKSMGKATTVIVKVP